MRREAFLVVLVLLAGCMAPAPASTEAAPRSAGPSDISTGTETGSPASNQSAAPTPGNEPRIVRGDATLGYAYYLDLCVIPGFGGYAETEKALASLGPRLDSTEVVVTFSWDPGASFADELRFVLLDEAGNRTAQVQEGPSPQTIRLDHAALALAGDEPVINVRPGPCARPPVVYSGSTTVSFTAEWT